MFKANKDPARLTPVDFSSVVLNQIAEQIAPELIQTSEIQGTVG